MELLNKSFKELYPEIKAACAEEGLLVIGGIRTPEITTMQAILEKWMGEEEPGLQLDWCPANGSRVKQGVPWRIYIVEFSPKEEIFTTRKSFIFLRSNAPNAITLLTSRLAPFAGSDPEKLRLQATHLLASTYKLLWVNGTEIFQVTDIPESAETWEESQNFKADQKTPEKEQQTREESRARNTPEENPARFGLPPCPDDHVDIEALSKEARPKETNTVAEYHKPNLPETISLEELTADELQLHIKTLEAEQLKNIEPSAKADFQVEIDRAQRQLSRTILANAHQKSGDKEVLKASALPYEDEITSPSSEETSDEESPESQSEEDPESVALFNTQLLDDVLTVLNPSKVIADLKTKSAEAIDHLISSDALPEDKRHAAHNLVCAFGNFGNLSVPPIATSFEIHYIENRVGDPDIEPLKLAIDQAISALETYTKKL